MKAAVAIVLFAALSAQTCFAGLEPYGAGARATGMGEAFVAVADDLSAIDHNPAGLGEMTRPAASAQYADLLGKTDATARVSAGNLSAEVPLQDGRSGVMGVGVRRFQAASFFTEQRTRLAYGITLLPAGGSDERVSVGAALTRFTRTYGGSTYADNAVDGNGVATGRRDPVFANGRSTPAAYSLDLGALCRFGVNSLGASISSLNRPDVSLAKDGDRAPRLFRLGAARRFDATLVSLELRRTEAAAGSATVDLAAGAEKWFSLTGSGRFAVRGGYAQGTGELRTVYAGLSAQTGSLRIDYAFNVALGAFADAGLNHQVTLSWMPGATPR